jgi:hypothetical protein
MPATDVPVEPITAEQLAQIDIPGKVTELIRGKLVVREPPSTQHGRLSANLCYFMGRFAREHMLGDVFAQDTGFKIESNPDTVRAPDDQRATHVRAALSLVRLAPLHLIRNLRSRRTTNGELQELFAVSVCGPS